MHYKLSLFSRRSTPFGSASRPARHAALKATKLGITLRYIVFSHLETVELICLQLVPRGCPDSQVTDSQYVNQLLSDGEGDSVPTIVVN